MTLFQIKPVQPSSKPFKSSVQLQLSDMSTLQCQKIKPFISKKDKVPLDSFTVRNKLFTADCKSSSSNDLSFILSCLRSGFVHSENLDLIPTWAGCRSLLSNSRVTLMHVGFLPYIPHPVTDYSTICTALHNFQSVLAQLHQQSLPISCDEGVFRIVVDIYFQRPDEYKNLIPMLGGFHMGKAVEHCIRKFMKGSGIENAFVETGTFGPNVVEAVIAGSQYERSLRGIQIVYDVLQQLKWESFWASRDKTSYQPAITDLGNLLSFLL